MGHAVASTWGFRLHSAARAQQRVEQPLDQAAAIEDDVGLEGRVRPQRDFVAVGGYGLTLEACCHAIGRLLRRDRCGRLTWLQQRIRDRNDCRPVEAKPLKRKRIECDIHLLVPRDEPDRSDWHQQ